MQTHFFQRLFMASRPKPEQALLAMRFAMGLGWGMVVGLALGFVLCWGVVQRFAAPSPMLWRAVVPKISTSAPPAPTVAKVQTGR